MRLPFVASARNQQRGRYVSNGRYISYLRVSTAKQGANGLGIDAQRKAVADYLNGGCWTLLAEYVEQESGRKSDRPELAKALAHAKTTGATLIVAKLDRLTRNTAFLLSVAEGSGDRGVVFCDLPQIPPGPMGKFFVTLMAAVAELEAGLVSQRTKAALAAAKARGVRMGNPNGAAALRRAAKARGRAINADAITATIAAADRHAAQVRPIIDGLRAEGITSQKGIARALWKAAWKSDPALGVISVE